LAVALGEQQGAESSEGVMKLHIRSIDKAQDFKALAPIWARLTRETGQLSPFLSYDWFWCCWHGVWPQRRPEILVIEESAGPIAIVPLMHWREWVCGLPVRYVGFLEWPNTPWVDILTVGEYGSVLETFLDHLASRSDWDTAWLQKLPAISPTLKSLEGILPGRLPWRHAGHLLYPYIEIEGDWDRFVGAKHPLGTEFNRKLQAQLNCAGNVSLEEHRTIDLQSPFLQEALAIMNRSRQTDGDVAIATMPRTLEFFRELTRHAAKNGWLSLWSLQLDGHVVALEYQLRSNGKVQALWTGDDPAYRELLPGNVLHLAILQSLFEGGRVYEYSLIPGMQDAHHWWATASHETAHLKIYRPSLYPRLLERLEAAHALGARK
jgi:CelD/BcsL family acetyltransferase involved in cellulose biosynthesis